jgi:hypothetical protein
VGGAIADLPKLGRHGKQLVDVLTRLLGLLESGVRDLDGSGYISPQQPFGDIAQRIWHFRRARFAGLHHLWLLFAAGGPLERIAAANGWLPQLEALRAKFLESFHALNRIRYFGSEDGVELGDHVELRGFFRKTQGRVSYLPGQPRHSAELDHGGLVSVGIQTRRGTFLGVFVDPDTLELKQSVKLLRRDGTRAPAAPSEEELQE